MIRCLESKGSIAMTPIRRGRPAFLDEASSAQFFPPSLVLKSPTPGYESAEPFASPVPQYTVSGEFGSIANDPILSTG